MVRLEDLVYSLRNFQFDPRIMQNRKDGNIRAQKQH